MTPEAAGYLGKARELLDEATTALAWVSPMLQAAPPILPGFHAAQAYLSTQSERVPKTHSGLRSEFARRVKDEPRITELQRAFLGRAYSFKAIADYETGPSRMSATNRPQGPLRKRAGSWRLSRR